MQYVVKTLESLDEKQQKQLLELFLEADFADASDGTGWLDDAVRGSLLAAGAFDSSGNLIGFARVLGDGVSDCYIQDVAVKIDCRGQGVGKALVEYLLCQLEKNGIDWVGLIATPGKVGFYRKLGFEVMEDFTPMRLKKE